MGIFGNLASSAANIYNQAGGAQGIADKLGQARDIANTVGQATGYGNVGSNMQSNMQNMQNQAQSQALRTLTPYAQSAAQFSQGIGDHLMGVQNAAQNMSQQATNAGGPVSQGYQNFQNRANSYLSQMPSMNPPNSNIPSLPGWMHPGVAPMMNYMGGMGAGQRFNQLPSLQMRMAQA